MKIEVFSDNLLKKNGSEKSITLNFASAERRRKISLLLKRVFQYLIFLFILDIKVMINAKYAKKIQVSF